MLISNIAEKIALELGREGLFGPSGPVAWKMDQHCVFTPWSEYFFHGFWYLEGLVYDIFYV